MIKQRQQNGFDTFCQINLQRFLIIKVQIIKMVDNVSLTVFFPSLYSKLILYKSVDSS